MKPAWACAALVVALLAAGAGAAQEAGPPVPEAVFVTLGTGGGPVTRMNRSQPANAVVVGDAVYLFDVGDGVQRQLVAAGLDIQRVRAVFVSHHHLDHNADLGPVLSTRWLMNAYQPVPVIGPPGTRRMVAALVEAAAPLALAPLAIGGTSKPGLATTIEARDLPDTLSDPTVIFEDANLRVLAVTNAHYNYPPESAEAGASRSYSFRIETAGRSIVYTGDTGPSENLVRLASGADLLVSEVIDMTAMRIALDRAEGLPPAAVGPLLAHMAQDHMTGTAVGTLATEAGVGAVVLTHFAPGLDSDAGVDGYTHGVHQRYQGPVTAARDLDRF